MKNQWQHLTETQRNELLKLLQRSEELFYGTFGTWKTDPLEFKLKIYKADMFDTISSTKGT